MNLSLVRPQNLSVNPAWFTAQPDFASIQPTNTSSQFVRRDQNDLIAIGEVKGTILFVDDNLARYQCTAEGLAEAGYNVYYAENGQEALETIDQIGLGLLTFIVSDFNMPVMDGGQFHDNLRSREDGKVIPFIFSSVVTTAQQADVMKKSQESSPRTGFADPTKKLIEQVILTEYRNILAGRPTLV